MMISGLTQYADVRFEQVQVVINNVATYQLECATLSSMLFADVERNTNDIPTPMDMRDQLNDASILMQELLINAKHQQHSFKKANHLWKEKFFQINATLGPMRVIPLANSQDKTVATAVSLPARSHIALSCHLSAACTSLKSVSVDVIVGTMNVDADQILSLYQSTKAETIYSHGRTHSADHTSNTDQKRKSLFLLKELTMSMGNIAVAKRIISTTSEENSEKLNFSIETASISCIRDQRSQDIDTQEFPHSANFSTKSIQLDIRPATSAPETKPSTIFAVSGIKACLKATESVLLSKKQALTAQIVDTFAADDNPATEDPNIRFVNGSIDVVSPSITLDMIKLSSYQDIVGMLTQPKQSRKKKTSTVPPTAWHIQKVPRFMLSLSISSPTFYIYHFSTPETLDKPAMPSYTGFDLRDVLITFRGNYTQSSEDPASPPILSPLGSPTHTPESFLHPTSPPLSPTSERPMPTTRWQKLLRRSWRSYKSPSSGVSARHWTFDVLASVRLLECSSAYPYESTTASNHSATLNNTLMHVDEINISVRSSLTASIITQKKRQSPLMQLIVDQPTIEFCLSIDKPSINLWAEYASRKQLSILQQAMSKTLEITKSSQRLKVDTSDNSKTKSIYQPYLRNVNVTFAVHNLCVGVIGFDEGVRRKRKIPDGYLDNAPNQDIRLGLAFYIESLSINYKTSKVNTDRALAESILEVPDNQTLLGAVDVFLTGTGLSPCAGLSNGQVLYLSGLGGERDCFIHLSQVDSRSVLRMKSDENGLTLISKSSISFGRMLVYYTLQNHYAMLLAILALKSFVPKQSTKKSTPSQKKFNVDVEKCAVALHHVDIRCLLPGDLNLKGFGQSEKHILISSSGVHITVPFGYVVANIIDSSVSTFKSLKLLHARLFSEQHFDWNGPIPKNNPVKMPTIQLRFEILTFTIEDDPFEANLRLIYKTGTIQQKVRLANEDAFTAKAQAMASQQQQQQRQDDENGRRALDGEQEHNAKVWIKSIHSAQKEEQQGVQELCESRRQNRYKGVPDFGQRTLEFTSKYLADLFDITLVPPTRHLSLLFAAMRHMDLTISIPTFPLDQTRLFMQNIGDGIPLDTQFSTLAPFHLNWFADETWVQLRDYPLPLMYVPPKPKKDPNSWPQAWSLSGDYVFGDELGTKLATRLVDVVLVDLQNGANYNMSVPRTTSPPKFYSVVEIHCLVSNPARLAWAQSVQPAIQDVSRVFDYFTRPPVDPSEKLGFWDKIRHMIHTRTRIRFNGDLAVCLKGTRDPYNLIGRGAGFVKVWKKEVQWLLGYQNPQGEFMQVLSQEYMLAVPDLVNGTYVVKHILPITADNAKSRQRSETTNATVSSPTTRTEARKFKSPDSPTVGLKLSGGVRWGLGCKYERRCEANCQTCHGQGECRSLDFIPHYRIKYCTPANAAKRPDGGKNYDAYTGFRSHFIHFSVSIVQNTNTNRPFDAVNALHLSPGFVDHFLQWFRLFGGGMGLPIRAGPLFPKPDTRATKKFGKHMSTVKYKIVTDNLFIGWFEKDEQSLYSINGTGHTVGMKALVSSFKVDLHQRRIITKIDSDELGTERIKPHWLLNEAQIQLSDLDLRVVQATYPNIDPNDDLDFGRNHAMPSVVIDETSTINSESSQTFESINSDFEEPFGFPENVPQDWEDLDDYVELDLRTPDFRPVICVFPMMFSPNICYFKQSNCDDVERFRYLHGTHECIMGSALDTRAVQVNLLKKRMEAIDEQIRTHQERLDDVEQRLKKLPYETDLLNESQSIVEKTTVLFEKKSLLQRYLKSVLIQSMPDLPRTHSNVATKHSLLENDPTDKWEALMGYFKQRCIVHNPQIIWNNSVRNLVYRLLDVHGQQRAHTYYMSMRAVKFLRDLTNDINTKMKFRSASPMDSESDQVLDMEMANDIIEKLLADHKPNSSNPPTVTDDSSSHINGHNDDTLENNLNDPNYQYSGVPSGYEMKSSYIVELLNPQISLQSDRNPDSIVLVSTERTQIKSFHLYDCSGDDFDTAIVKNRTLFSVDNIQFFVAKKEHFDTVDLLFDNHYGARGNEHWLTWIPLEMLINYTKRSDKFQRVADRAAATMQYDTFNPLRLKTSQEEFSRINPLQERCDSMTVSFPSLVLTANSTQYNAIVDVVMDLVLYSEPARKERLERLKEIMLTADMDNLTNATDTIIFLQNSIRQLATTQEQYRLTLPDLREQQLQEYKLIQGSLQHYKEELYLVMEAIKKNPGGKQDSMQAAQTKLKVTFLSQKIIWEMIIESERTLCEWTLNNARYVWLNKEDHSSSNTLELDMIQCINRLPNPTFAEIISPYLENRKQVDFSKQKMLRGYLHDLPPVGGIPVVQHLEINLFPLKFQMTHEFGKLLASYVFPVEKRKGATQAIPISSSSSAPNVSSSAISSKSTSYEPPNSMASSSYGDLRGVSKDSSSLSTSSDIVSSDTLMEPVRSNSLRPMRSEDHLRGTSSSGTNTSKRSHGKKHSKNASNNSVPNADDLSVMKERASNNRTFIYIKVPRAKHCLSYQGPKEKNIEDLYEFVFSQPTLEYRNRTWSWYELMNAVKKDFLRAALKHSGLLIRDKLKIRRHPRAPRTTPSSSSFVNEPMYQKALAAASASEQQKPSTSSSISITTQSSDGYDNQDDISIHDMDSIDASSDNFDQEGSTQRKKHKMFSAWSRSNKSEDNPPSPKSPSRQSILDDSRSAILETEVHRKGKLLFGKSYSGPFRPSSPSTHSRSANISD
ncbi:golgi-body localization protein domain-containing protein [Umbelopsis sp. PMI_123]|nr:golgi-body localization protein domain-containing protein [Umbelopsis sp. PMI_123]